MPSLSIPSGCAVVIVSACIACSATADWPHFRGPDQNGSASDAKLPTEWSVQTGNHIAWSAELPGRGPSSPILVGDRLFVTCSSGHQQDRLHVLAFDAGTGEPLWERRFWATGRTSCHPTSANAAPTPTSDGERIYCLFSSCDFICLDLEGNLCWYRGLALDYPKAGNDVGMSSSPVIVGDVVVAQIECQGDSFIEGIDGRSGATRWHIAREAKSNWSSPIALFESNGKSQVVLAQSEDGLTAIDVADGAILWKKKMICDAISSSSPGSHSIFTPANGMTALKPLEGNRSVEVLWHQSRLKPGAASPIVHDGHIFTLNRAGVLSCGDVATGDIAWRLRLQGTFWSTPIAVGNRLYATSDDGVVHVVALDEKKGKLLAKNELCEAIQASPAVSGNAIYFRSDRRLWKIAVPE